MFLPPLLVFDFLSFCNICLIEQLFAWPHFSFMTMIVSLNQFTINHDLIWCLSAKFDMLFCSSKFDLDTYITITNPLIIILVWLLDQLMNQFINQFIKQSTYLYIYLSI
jgi:hypothetical protein